MKCGFYELDITPPSESIIPGTENYQRTFFVLQAFLVQANKRTLRKIDLQVFRIGSTYILGTPCQLFVQCGKRMKKACGGRQGLRHRDRTVSKVQINAKAAPFSRDSLFART